MNRIKPQFLAALLLFIVSSTTLAADGVWTHEGTGSWSDANNWQGHIIADGVDGTATFSGEISDEVHINIDSNRVIGNLLFPAAENNYRSFQGDGSLTLQTSSGQPAITTDKYAVFNVPFHGSQGFEKLGSEVLTLQSDSDYTGITTVGEGIIIVWNSNSLGASGSGNYTVIADGANVEVWENTNESFVITGSGDGRGAIRITDDDTIVSGDITLNGSAQISSSNSKRVDITGDISVPQGVVLTIHRSGGSFNIYGIIQGSGAVTFDSGATLYAANTFTGDTNFSQSLDVCNNDALQNSTVQMNGSISFRTGVSNPKFGGLAGAADCNLSQFEETRSLTVGGNGQDTTYSGSLQGAGSSLIKIGSGTLMLTGDNSGYNGGITLSDGTLNIYGTLNTGLVEVGAHGTGTFINSGGVHTMSNSLYVGTYTDGSGQYQISENSQLITTNIYLGNDGDGTLLQNGGTVSMTGNMYLGYWPNGEGTYSINNGTMTINGSLIVGGKDVAGGASNVNVSGGQITAGTLKIWPGSSLNVKLNRKAVPTAYILAGTTNLGGTLNINLADGYVPANGDVFDILDWTTLSSNFDTINLPILPEGYSWDTSDFYVNGTMAISGPDFSGGDGSADNPYQIANKTQLLTLAGNTNYYDKCFILIDDVDMGGQTFTTAIIAPTGNPAFIGSFDGKGHIIGNFTINGGSNDYIGLFGSVENGLIKNLGVEDSSVSGDKYVGILAGEGENIINCHSVGTASGAESVGGLIGKAVNNISRCWSSGSITSSSTNCYFGGLVGKNSGTIIGCYSTCDINTPPAEYVGGLVGTNEFGVIRQCYATGAVSGRYFVGGLAGGSSGTISYCYSTGLVNASGNWYGGLLGYLSYGTVSRSLWDMDTSGQTTSAGGTGKTTEQMKMISTFNGWDFTNETANGNSNFWRMCVNGVDYPRLSSQSLAGDLACPDGVTIQDLEIFVERWLSSGCNKDNNWCGQTDMNLSGDIDFQDFAEFAERWSNL